LVTRNSKLDSQNSQDLSSISLKNKVETKEEEDVKKKEEAVLERSTTVDQGKAAKRRKMGENTNDNSEEISLKVNTGYISEASRKDFRRDIPDQPIICYENRLINQSYDQNAKVFF
jgi:hypothetical protein